MKIVRYESTDMGTFGILTLKDLTLHTIERPWLNNEPFKSCIPAGDYALVPFTRSNGANVYALVGNGVSIEQDYESKRYAILIHIGNYVDDVVGCIAPGLSRDRNMVQHSSKAMGLLMERLTTAVPLLTIEWGEVDV